MVTVDIRRWSSPLILPLAAYPHKNASGLSNASEQTQSFPWKANTKSTFLQHMLACLRTSIYFWRWALFFLQGFAGVWIQQCRRVRKKIVLRTKEKLSAEDLDLTAWVWHRWVEILQWESITREKDGEREEKRSFLTLGSESERDLFLSRPIFVWRSLILQRKMACALFAFLQRWGRP